MGPPGVATCSCAPTSKRCSRIQTSSPHRVWPLHVQVCAPFTYGQFSKVSPIFICGRQMQRAAQLWPPPPTSSYYPPPDSRPRPRRGPSSLDGLHRPRCSPTSSCASPTLGATPSRLQAPQPLPALPAAAPPIPAVPPSCASPLPQMCTLPAPPHSPTRPGAASTSHNAPRRGPARPGPCSRDAPRGLPPLFPRCLARRLPPNLRFPAGHSSIQSNSGSGLFPSVLCGRARPTSSPFQGVSRPGNYNSQRPPRDGGSDVARPRPSTRPRPRPPKSAREVGGANLGLRGCSGRDAQHNGARAWREKLVAREEEEGGENSDTIMQRSIRSFFQPKKEGKVKKPEKETSNSIRETESPPKVALKERNRVVSDGDSPVKRPGRKATRVLGSEGEEEEEEAPTTPRSQEPASDSPQPSPPSLVTLPESSPSRSKPSPAVASPSWIPKRRTARKQLPKRTFQDVLKEQGEDEDPETKKKKEEGEAETPTESLPEPEGGDKEEVEGGDQPTTPPEPQTSKSPTESVSEPGVTVKQEPQEDGQAQPPPKAPKTLSSFFSPRKPAVKKEAKEGGPGALRKDETKGHLDPPSYNPAKNNYHPIEDACWKAGQRVPYLAVARAFEKIEEVSARLRMVETLSNLLRSVVALSPADLLPVLYLSLNRLGPPQQGLELGIGEGILLKAVAQATGRQLESVRAEVAEKGDVGLVAESSRSTQRLVLPPPALTAGGVFAKFRDIAQLAGSASTTKKMDVIKGLFVACRHSEARFIARALSGRLRLGLAEQSVLAALAQAVSLTPPGQECPPVVVDAGKGKTAEARKTWLEEQGMILKQTFCEVPDLDRIVPVLLEHGLERLPEHCRLSPGVPLKPMLAHPTRGVSEVLKRFEEAAFTCEYKYDGQRAQIHVLEGGEVKIFSRNQEDNTGRYPDIISRIPKIKLPSVTSFILDTEAVAWDREKKQIQPFQVLTTRKRKEVDAAEIQVQVCLYAFDLIYLNGESLVREPLSRRRQLLRENFVETEGEFVFATSLDTKDTEQIAEFLEQSVKDSCEGLMVKTLDVDATYEIAKRSHNWLKLKKDYLEGVGDTLDLVVIGAYLGKGKRAGRYGGFLLASYDEESEEFQAICKLGTGFSDEELEEHHQRLQALVLPTPRSYVRADGAVAPDHWLDPSDVWEVKCADLSLSPIYPAARGLVDSEKGISLRFPRFIRVREDKKPEQATTSAQVAGLYKKQSQIQNQQGAEPDSEQEEFY